MVVDPVVIGVGIGSSILFAIICAVIAGTKHRSAGGWFFGGLFLGLIGLIIVACLPTIKEN